MNILSVFEKRKVFNIEQMDREVFLECLSNCYLHSGVIKYYDENSNVHIIKCINNYYDIDSRNAKCYAILKKANMSNTIKCNDCIKCHQSACNKWLLEELTLR